jgi:frataxin-like iron-binding protein CyaY
MKQHFTIKTSAGKYDLDVQWTGSLTVTADEAGVLLISAPSDLPRIWINDFKREKRDPQ